MSGYQNNEYAENNLPSIDDVPSIIRGDFGFGDVINPDSIDHFKKNTNLIDRINNKNNNGNGNNNDDSDIEDYNDLEAHNNNNNNNNNMFNDDNEDDMNEDDMHDDMNDDDMNGDVESNINMDDVPTFDNNLHLNGGQDDMNDTTDVYKENVVLTKAKIREMKVDYLTKLEKIQKHGYKPYKTFTMSDELEDIKAEFMRIENIVKTEKSVSFQKKVIVGVASLVEIINNAYPYFDIHLNGWSEELRNTLDENDDVFVELYEKYKDMVTVMPELRLAGIIFFSGLSFHFTSKYMDDLAKKAPDHHRIINNNPQLKQLFEAELDKERMNAMNKTQGGSFINNIFGAFNKLNVSGNTQPLNKQSSYSSAPAYTQASYTSSAPPVVNEPSGADDILKLFDETPNNNVKTINIDSDVESIVKRAEDTKSNMSRIKKIKSKKN